MVTYILMANYDKLFYSVSVYESCVRECTFRRVLMILLNFHVSTEDGFCGIQ